MTSALAAVAVVAFDSPLTAQVRPCDLVTPAEVTAIVGAAPATGKPSGPDEDKARGVKSWDCGWQAGEHYVFVSVTRLASEAAATRAMSEAGQLSRVVPEGIELNQVPGPGDHAMWGVSEEGAIWVARRGVTILALVYAGEKSEAAVREPMRRALAAAFGRLR